MAATTQVQILERTNSSWEGLDARSFGQCPWACLQGQLAHDRATEMLEPLGVPVEGSTLLIEQKGCWLGPRGSGVSACASPVVTGLSALAPLTATP